MLIIPVIRTDEEYRKAWEYLVLSRSLGYENPHLVMLKRDIRAYARKSRDRKCIGDGDVDGYTELITCPDYVASSADAEDWFESVVRIAACSSAYGCTGREFTCWHKTVFRHDRWYIYHRVCRDV